MPPSKITNKTFSLLKHKNSYNILDRIELGMSHKKANQKKNKEGWQPKLLS